ncbi:hypothetical protein AAG570_008778 [Ranatra chinensis]|uniref:Uncharacterized protein n=1 Tax=Ranatra chinensis TaxID=642074 RepID=A0ABD0YS00_9HEMI
MASKRRNMFQKNKTQETTENGRRLSKMQMRFGDQSAMSIRVLGMFRNTRADSIGPLWARLAVEDWVPLEAGDTDGPHHSHAATPPPIIPPVYQASTQSGADRPLKSPARDPAPGASSVILI